MKKFIDTHGDDSVCTEMLNLIVTQNIWIWDSTWHGKFQQLHHQSCTSTRAVRQTMPAPWLSWRARTEYTPNRAPIPHSWSCQDTSTTAPPACTHSHYDLTSSTLTIWFSLGLPIAGPDLAKQLNLLIFTWFCSSTTAVRIAYNLQHKNIKARINLSTVCEQLGFKAQG